MRGLDLYAVDSNNIDSISEQLLDKSFRSLTYVATAMNNKEEKKKGESIEAF